MDRDYHQCVVKIIVEFRVLTLESTIFLDAPTWLLTRPKGIFAAW